MPELVEVNLAGKATTRDLAEHWDVPVATVQIAARRGSIPGAARILGRYYFDKEEALAGWEPTAVKLRRDGGVVKDSHLSTGGFAPGNTAGVGNRGGRPSRKKEEQYLKAMKQVVTVEDWIEITTRAMNDAKKGDHRARKWLTDHLIGTPTQRIESEVHVTARREFELGERASAVLALLEAKQGIDDNVIEGSAEVVGELESLGEGPTGRSLTERPFVDAPS